LRSKEEVAPEAFSRPAALVRRFVEDYHERNEELFIFPEFEKRKTLVELGAILRAQHNGGRALTATIAHRSSGAEYRKTESRELLAFACQDFIRMYRPHEAREGTVLFPALHRLIGSQAVKEMGG
jgi:hemerythrin-like domain-containing protein